MSNRWANFESSALRQHETVWGVSCGSYEALRKASIDQTIDVRKMVRKGNVRHVL